MCTVTDKNNNIIFYEILRYERREKSLLVWYYVQLFVSKTTRKNYLWWGSFIFAKQMLKLVFLYYVLQVKKPHVKEDDK